nr:hypothetical protein [Tanacetum cinerariifolium]
MLMTMDLEIQKNLEQLGAYDMLQELKTLFSQQAEHKLLSTVKEFYACKQEEGQSVRSYVLRMKSYIYNLEHLGHPMSLSLAVGLILVFLSKEYDSFVQNYNMHCMKKIVNELHVMLKLHEQTLPKKNVAPMLHAKPSGDGIYEIDLSNSNTNDSSMYVVSNKIAKLNLDSTLLWHYVLDILARSMARKPYSHQVERAKDLLRLIHTDVCGPFRTVSRQGDSYFVTFTNDFSRYRYVYLLKHKHEVFETFKVFQKEVEIQLKKTIKSLRSDRGGKYMIQEFLDHLKEHGIITHLTPPYTPQHNSVFERRNKTLFDMVRFMMSQTILPKFFWDYVVESVARILNMIPTKKVEKTPYEVWHGQSPKMSYLRVWGYETLVNTHLNKVLVAWNVEFFENSLITQEASGSLEDLEIIQDEDTHSSENTSLHHDEVYQEIDEPQSDINPISRSTRTRHAPYRMCLYVDVEEHELGDLNEFANYKVALLDTESDKWLIAMNVEMQSMKDNQVWDLVDLPLNGKTVGSKWLFKKKTDMNENIHTYKARLVANGFSQTYGVDYEKTFSPVADNRAIRILIAIVAFYEYEIGLLDVKTAFSQLTLLIDLCQSAYVEKILKIFHMENSKRGSIPVQDKPKLCKSQGTSTPAENPGELYWTVVKNILKYLRNTKDMFLVYGGDIKRELRVACYTDAGYLTDVDDCKSRTGYTGYAFVLNEGVVDWKSTKHSIFVTSSAKVEYIAASDVAKEAVWIRKLIYGLGVVPINEEPIEMYCENTGAITIANEPGITKGARHYHAKVHYLREVINFGDIVLKKVYTYDNVADPFTNALPFNKYSEHTKNIGLLPANCLM